MAYFFVPLKKNWIKNQIIKINICIILYAALNMVKVIKEYVIFPYILFAVIWFEWRWAPTRAGPFRAHFKHSQGALPSAEPGNREAYYCEDAFGERQGPYVQVSGQNYWRYTPCW